ncbi:GNAT family N-acetyltransferase [Roseivirga sp. UBA838]|uniref:GNAT family N-acetyltransferase n=1 Tax=Roseivirga sp. UBA838 TaxID=1947393 RepID=UPI00257B2889|nr:GNAT family N-acetyltransferase [Roseivirga sp. UBA838]
MKLIPHARVFENMELKIKQNDEETKGSFFIEEDGKRLAEMTYSKAGADKIIIDHTEVNDVLRGKGVGVRLVEAAVDYARGAGIKIRPLCPFARATFKRKNEWRDVLS